MLAFLSCSTATQMMPVERGSSNRSLSLEVDICELRLQGPVFILFRKHALQGSRELRTVYRLVAYGGLGFSFKNFTHCLGGDSDSIAAIDYVCIATIFTAVTLSHHDCCYY